MANISIRKLDEDVVAKLRVRAARHGVSMEEEIRQTLKKSVDSQLKLGDLAFHLFGDKYGVELDLHDRVAHKPLDL